MQLFTVIKCTVNPLSAGVASDFLFHCSPARIGQCVTKRQASRWESTTNPNQPTSPLTGGYAAVKKKLNGLQSIWDTVLSSFFIFCFVFFFDWPMLHTTVGGQTWENIWQEHVRHIVGGQQKYILQSVITTDYNCVLHPNAGSTMFGFINSSERIQRHMRYRHI